MYVCILVPYLFFHNAILFAFRLSDVLSFVRIEYIVDNVRLNLQQKSFCVHF